MIRIGLDGGPGRMASLWRRATWHVARCRTSPPSPPPWWCGAALLLLVLAGSADAAGRSITFRSADDFPIQALLFEPSLRPAPAVVLVPMLGRPKEDWDLVGQRIAAADIFAIAIDLPSTSDPGDAKALSAWSMSVRAAVAYLASRSEVRPGNVAIVGASLGSSLAAIAAAANPAIRSLALISPSIDYHGVRIDAPMKQYGGRPVLLMASNQDPYAARTVRELAKDPSGAREARFSDTAAHGTALLARDPEMVRVLVEWLQRTLG